MVKTTGKNENFTFANNLIANVNGPLALVSIEASENNTFSSNEFVSSVAINTVVDTIQSMTVIVYSESLTDLEFTSAWRSGKAIIDRNDRYMSATLLNVNGSYLVRIHKSQPSPFYIWVKCAGPVACRLYPGKGLLKPAESGGLEPHP
jgi:hypothetical protein